MGVFLYFLRHGQTAYSLTGGYCGTPENDPGLTEAGLAMAQEFADSYAALPWTAAYVSPLRRAVETAQPLCDRCHLQMQLRSGLREVMYGHWEGMHPSAVDQAYHDEYVAWLTDPVARDRTLARIEAVARGVVRPGSAARAAEVVIDIAARAAKAAPARGRRAA